MKAKVWFEDGVIKCLSQVCALNGVVCPRINECSDVEVSLIFIKEGNSDEEK